jgi:hypothetical protein
MKQIQPVSVWFNGEELIAQYLDSYITKDNLSDFASFWWGIYTEGSEPGKPGVQVAQGNLTMNGQTYLDWNANPDINDDAYLWIAAELSLTII